MNITDQTLDYYNSKARSFVDSTVNVEFSALQNEFVAEIPKGGRILDLGCGSGRDSKAFMEKGYELVAVDGSEELVKLASEYIGQQVIHTTFQDYEPDQTFDGIWACASLLHLKKEDIISVMKKLSGALKAEGIFYASFKYGDFSGERNGRYFTDLNEESLAELMKELPDLEIYKEHITVDARPGREDEKWLNVMLKRKRV